MSPYPTTRTSAAGDIRFSKTVIRRDDPSTLYASLAQRSSSVSWRKIPLRLVAIGLPIAMLVNFSGDPAPISPIADANAGEAQAAIPVLDDSCAVPIGALQGDLAKLSREFDGDVGIAVTRVGCDWFAGDRASAFFPQQSVSKLWVALAVLRAIDRGGLSLDQKLTIGPADLTLFNQPLRREVLEMGKVTRSVHSLLVDALSHSDNTANDRLLRAVGGPGAIKEVLRHSVGDGIRFGPGERELQSEIAGLQWSPQLSLGRNFEQARSSVPLPTRSKALVLYLADPMDGAEPLAIVRTLGRLSRGELLSPGSTKVMMDILAKTKSGPRRLKGGAPPGWAVLHKTGTGQELGKIATGYNDVGLLRAPDGTEYAVAVMIGQTTAAIPDRMALMQGVTRAVADFHNGIAKGGHQLEQSI